MTRVKAWSVLVLLRTAGAAGGIAGKVVTCAALLGTCDDIVKSHPILKDCRRAD
jgi:hypothetical protein